MPKRKYQKLPNGYGSIKKLSGKRRNPYGVYPPSKNQIKPGQYEPTKAICYVDTWLKGFAVLTAWHAGNYYPGYERTLNKLQGLPDSILADYVQAFRRDSEELKKPTFTEVYEKFYKWKYDDSGKVYSESTRNASKTAFKNCKELHNKIFEELKYPDLQAVIDKCPLKHASLETILSLFHQMYEYAEIFEICEKDYSAHVKIKKADDDEHGVPFSENELAILWEHKDNPTVEMLLIMCYSGYRITAYESLEVNLEEMYFKGGIKTKAGKGRIVPIHSAIQGLVSSRINRFGNLLGSSSNLFRTSMYNTLSALGIEKHTPHDCRHTFSALCEKYGVNENDRKRMLGHSFGTDITNGVYGHRTLEDLRTEIEKIKVCF